MFTIEVKKKEKDEEFGFEDLEMFHKECGGRIKQEPHHEHDPQGAKFNDRMLCKGFHVLGFGCSEKTYPVEKNLWILTCQRCAASIEVNVEPEFQATQVIATAIDGEEKKISGKLRVIQKI